jgi:hypothetical protein
MMILGEGKVFVDVDYFGIFTVYGVDIPKNGKVLIWGLIPQTPISGAIALFHLPV